MSDVTSEPLGTKCPYCGSAKTKLLHIGDPESDKISKTTVSSGVTITVTNRTTLGGCDDCRKTWFLPEA